MSKEKGKLEEKNYKEVMLELERINFEMSMIGEKVDSVYYRKKLPKFRYYISSDVARTTIVILAILVTIKYLFI
jgi:hypothetical protein